MQERNFKGVWIPKEIWLNENLSAIDKVILAEIDSLDNKETHCFASNTYFANFCGVSESTVTRSIKKLIDLKFIEIVSFDGRVRVVKMTRLPNQNDEAAQSKCMTNNKYNNTTNSNTLSKDSVRTSNSSETFSFGFSEEKTKSKPKRKTNDEEYLDACLLIDNFTDDLKLREKLKELFRNKKEECGKKRYHFHATTCKQYLEELSEVDDKLGAVKLSIQYNNTMKVMQPNNSNSNSSESKFIHIQNNGERVEQKKFDPKKDTLSDITF